MISQRGRGKAKARDNRYRVYLFKILQQVHPKVGITKTAMDIMNSFIEDMFEKICTEAMKLCAYNKTSTIGAREIATATKLRFLFIFIFIFYFYLSVIGIDFCFFFFFFLFLF